MEGENIFANDLTNNGLRSKLYKKCMQFKRKKKSNSKMGRGLNRHFPTEDIQMVNRYMKRYSTSLIITEIQTKTSLHYQKDKK